MYSPIALVLFPSSANGAECKDSLEICFRYTERRYTRGVWKRVIFCDREAQVVMGAVRDHEGSFQTELWGGGERLNSF